MENKKQNINKREISLDSNKKEDKMVISPFKSQEAQTAFGFVIGLAGLLLIAIGLNNPIPIITIGNLKISYAVLGFIIFFVGLFYFIDSLLK